MEQLEAIYKEAEQLQVKVNAFSGSKKNKEYIYMDEMLTRLLIKLDNIDSEGKEEIRNARRKAVKSVQASLDLLELKAMASNSELGKKQGSATSADEHVDKEADIKQSASDIQKAGTDMEWIPEESEQQQQVEGDILC